MTEARRPNDEELRAGHEARRQLVKPMSNGHAGNGAEAWPEPGRIAGSIPSAPQFPSSTLPAAVRGWALDQAERMQVPLDFLAIPALVTLAGSIGKTPTLRPKSRDDWAERPCLWATIIADPGSTKSSAFKAATSPLRAVEKNAMSDWRVAHAEWDAAEGERQLRADSHKKQVKKLLDKDLGAELPDEPDLSWEPEPPAPRRVTSDVTLEKLTILMAGSPGLTLLRDELSGWLVNMARYNAGSDQQFFLECWSGGSYAVDRVKRGSHLVDDLYLNVCGTIQLRKAAALFGDGSTSLTSDDGFLDRFGLIGYPEPLPDWEFVDRWPDSAKRRAYHEICERLAAANWHHLLRKETDEDIPHARFAEPAQERFNHWLTAHMRELPSLREAPTIGFMAKGRGTLVRLALAIHLARWAAGEADEASTVDLASLEAAISLFEAYLRPMYARIMAAFGAPEVQSAAERIAARIRVQRLEAIRPADITKLEWRGLRSIEDVERVLAALVAIDWLALPAQASGPKGGRPSRTYLVNPKVHACMSA